MLSFWTNYGAIKHLHGNTTFSTSSPQDLLTYQMLMETSVVPLVAQAIPAVLLLISMWLCNESPRFLAKQDRWEEATRVLTGIRQLPASHPYVQAELAEIAEQLEHERRLIGGASLKDLQKEMWLIPGNRKRALLTIGLMVCQQMTGTNASMLP